MLEKCWNCGFEKPLEEENEVALAKVLESFKAREQEFYNLPYYAELKEAYLKEKDMNSDKESDNNNDCAKIISEILLTQFDGKLLFTKKRGRIHASNYLAIVLRQVELYFNNLPENTKKKKSAGRFWYREPFEQFLCSHWDIAHTLAKMTPSTQGTVEQFKEELGVTYYSISGGNSRCIENNEQAKALAKVVCKVANWGIVCFESTRKGIQAYEFKIKDGCEEKYFSAISLNNENAVKKLRAIKEAEGNEKLMNIDIPDSVLDKLSDKAILSNM